MSKDKLSLIYDRRSKYFAVNYPDKADGGLALYWLLSEVPRYSLEKEISGDFPYREWYSFKEDLEKRGYDLKTLRFSIEKLKNESKNIK